jgi:DNA invertase Pin-like site-specific DNA recombinase
MGALPTKRKRCADYVRVSTDDQARKDYNSCEVQHDQCLRLIASRASEGWMSVLSLSDPGVSGATMERPGFQRLLQAIRAHEVDVLVVYNTDRLSRNATDYLNFLDFLREHGVELISVTQSLETKGAVGRFTNLLQAGLQQLERDRTAERTSDNMRERASKGWWNGGNTPLGYANIKKRLEIEPSEAAIIRLIYAQAASGTSLQAIANELNRTGHRTKERHRIPKGASQPVQGGRRLFRGDHIALIVRNPIYRGAVRWNGIEHAGSHTALVEPKLWEQANLAIKVAAEDNAAIAFRSQDRHHHLLKGLIHCADCAVSMTTHWTGKRDRSGSPYRYYECVRHVRREPSPQCAGRLPADQIEGVVLSALGQLGAHPALLTATLAAAKSGGNSEGKCLRRELAETDVKLKEISAQISTLIATIKGSRMAALEEELQTEAEALGKKKTDLIAERERLAIRAARWRRSNPDPVEIARSLEKFSELVLRLPRSKRKELVQLLVDRIEVRRLRTSTSGTQEFTVRLWCIVPPEPIDGADTFSQLESREGRSGNSARWQATIRFKLSRVGKGYRASFVEPFDEEVHTPIAETKAPMAAAEHSIAQALRWQEWIAKNPGKKPADVAREFKVTRATVSHRLALLELDPDIRSFLLRLADPEAIRFFSRRKLLPLASLAPNEQLRRFEKLKARLRRHPSVAA